MEQDKKAVALSYKLDKDIAPRVVAKGSGYLAYKIIEIAKNYNVPIYYNRNLTLLLYKLSVDEIIPASLYILVAEVLAWVYSIEKKIKNNIKT